MSIIRTSGLELEAPDGSMLTALGPDIQHLLNNVKVGRMPSRMFIARMVII